MVSSHRGTNESGNLFEGKQRMPRESIRQLRAPEFSMMPGGITFADVMLTLGNHWKLRWRRTRPRQ